MRTKPKQGEKVWWITLHSARAEDYFIRSATFTEDIDWKFNLFATRKEAEEARKKIVEILRNPL